jgi:hypothetical protein
LQPAPHAGQHRDPSVFTRVDTYCKTCVPRHTIAVAVLC